MMIFGGNNPGLKLGDRGFERYFQAKRLALGWLSLCLRVSVVNSETLFSGRSTSNSDSQRFPHVNKTLIAAGREPSPPAPLPKERGASKEWHHADCLCGTVARIRWTVRVVQVVAGLDGVKLADGHSAAQGQIADAVQQFMPGTFIGGSQPVLDDSILAETSRF